MGVGPDYDVWWKKYDAWNALNRMRRLVGTGFYIPPEWYNHFRLFPPPHNTPMEEQTQNPQAHTEHQKGPYESASRMELRDALAKQSRGAASAGNRYMNLFWVTKPLDEMERSYYRYCADLGLSHEEAIQRVVREYHSREAVRMRVQAIQQEEAKLSGKFLTMREGTAVIHALAHVHGGQLAPHEFAALATGLRNHNTKRRTRRIVPKRARKQEPTTAAPAPPATSAPEGTTPSSEGASTTTPPSPTLTPEFVEPAI
jgi:hypothetical protein